MTKAEIVVMSAESQIGSPYVYGAWGATCTPALRRKYAKLNPSQEAVTFQRCQVLRPDNPKKSCDGCKYKGKLAFDCRGFTHWALKQADIDITGGYVGRQWSDPNWVEKGDISVMPDLVCCVFIRKANGNWSHTGLHIGGGKIIHCSGEVKYDTVGGSRNWTHYGIPKGLYTDDEISKAHEGRPIMRTLKRGATGEDVQQVQEMLNKLGYDCGTADGIYGKKTEDAVRKFQEANNIAVDGIAGPVTLMLIAARAAVPEEMPENPVEPDDSDAELNAIEERVADIQEQISSVQAMLNEALHELSVIFDQLSELPTGGVNVG